MALSLGWIAWIVIGGLAGWVASMIKGTNAQMGLLANIVVGVIGGLIGGWLLALVGFDVAGWGWFLSFFTCLLGAVILLTIVNAIRR
jgi:uncharacterized membrane protein YeaQ/YmgE (transglycosylase-associated protein family)